MADYGAKGAPSGYDVNTAADYLLQFNSSWPSLKIASTGNYSGTISHGLGYPPFHMLARPAGGSGTNDGRLDQFASNYGVDSSVLARNSGSGTPRYFIFRLPLNQDFTAPIIPGGTTPSSGAQDFGFKIAQPGKSIDSTDMRDFTLHSGTRSPMVSMVRHSAMTNTGAGLGYEYSVNHNLGYAPLAFVFLRPGTNALGLATDKYGIVMAPIGVTGRYFTVDAQRVYVTADSGSFSTPPLVSVVILKDPFARETVSRVFP